MEWLVKARGCRGQGAGEVVVWGNRNAPKMITKLVKVWQTGYGMGTEVVPVVSGNHHWD